MTTIKFDKSVKYKGVRYAAHEAFEVADEDVLQLVESGATVLSTDTPADPETACQTEEETDAVEDDSEDHEDVEKLKEELLSYSVNQLTTFAQKRGISLQGKTRKADIYNVIVGALN